MDLNKVEKIDNRVRISNVLISTADKSGIEDFVNGLVKINPDVNIFSTGGTYSRIKEILGDKSEKNLNTVSYYTGQPEMQGGLVKTLDFKIYLGLLSETYNEYHKSDLKRTDAIEFDMVVVNLYPFKETVKREDCVLEDARANIDIGGPCMLRASAKNFLRVASVSDPSDYDDIINHLSANNGEMDFKMRFKLAKKTFNHTAGYDSAISDYLNNIDVAEAAEIYKML